MFLILVHGKNGPTEKAVSERVFRGMLNYIDENEGSEKALVDAINS